MARARNIKPGFFSNEELVELQFSTRLLFIGLWTLADRMGRMEDRPKRIKMDLFPADNIDVDSALNDLQQSGFLLRYVVDGVRYIQVLAFDKHQNPHRDEKASTIPTPCQHSASTMQVQNEHNGNPADSLIPDSFNLIPDSLTADSLIPESTEKQPPAPAVAAPAKKVSAVKEAPNPLNLETWKAYKQAYAERYSVAPVQDAATNSKIKAIVKGLGESAPHVAAFFVAHNSARYVGNMHQIGFFATDYAKLHTEWATNTKMTQAKAQQADKTATNLDAFAPLIAEARAREEAERNQS
jgi:hypothetical protein